MSHKGSTNDGGLPPGLAQNDPRQAQTHKLGGPWPIPREDTPREKERVTMGAEEGKIARLGHPPFGPHLVGTTPLTKKKKQTKKHKTERIGKNTLYSVPVFSVVQASVFVLSHVFFVLFVVRYLS